MQSSRPVVQVAAVAPVILAALAGTMRVAIIGVGDSNQQYSTVGYSDGCEAAASTAGFPIFATPLLGLGGAGNVGIGANGGDIQASGETQALTNLPAQLTGYVPSATYMTMMQPYWREDNVTDNDARGYQLAASNAIGNNRALRTHQWFGTGPSWGGSLKVGFRQDSAPYTQHVSVTKTLTGAASAAWGLRRETVDIAAGVGAAAEPLLCQLYHPAQAQTAPIFSPFQCTERPDLRGGLMVTPLIFAPSQHLGTIEATYRTGCPDAWKIAHMQALAVVLGPDGKFIWYINSGINDQSGSRTAAQFIADCERFRVEVLRISALAGIAADRHYFLVQPTHPQNSATPDGVLRTYGAALLTYIQQVPRVGLLNLHSALSGTAADWTARHDAGGAAHLKTNTAGYQAVWIVVWGHLLSACRAAVESSTAQKAVGAGIV